MYKRACIRIDNKSRTCAAFIQLREYDLLSTLLMSYSKRARCMDDVPNDSPRCFSVGRLLEGVEEPYELDALDIQHEERQSTYTFLVRNPWPTGLETTKQC